MSERPKRPMTAYLLWLSSAREQIKSDNPGLKVTEIAKKGGEIWRNMGEDSKAVWLERAAKLREQYHKDMEEYRKQAGCGDRAQRGKGSPYTSSESSSEYDSDG